MALIKCLTKRKLDLEERLRPYHYVPLVTALTLHSPPGLPSTSICPFVEVNGMPGEQTKNMHMLPQQPQHQGQLT